MFFYIFPLLFLDKKLKTAKLISFNPINHIDGLNASFYEILDQLQKGTNLTFQK